MRVVVERVYVEKEKFRYAKASRNISTAGSGGCVLGYVGMGTIG